MLDGLLTGYQATGDVEEADVARMASLTAAAADPWSRAQPLHFTASALVVHPPTSRVLLRWHVRLGRWLQVGGHADPGESDPLAVAMRESREETGLTDLVPWPDERLRHAVICHVPASAAEPAHEHADLRYILSTGRPDEIAPENDRSPLRWLTLDEARALVGDNNLCHTLDRAAACFERGVLSPGGSTSIPRSTAGAVLSGVDAGPAAPADPRQPASDGKVRLCGITSWTELTYAPGQFRACVRARQGLAGHVP